MFIIADKMFVIADKMFVIADKMFVITGKLPIGLDRTVACLFMLQVATGFGSDTPCIS